MGKHADSCSPWGVLYSQPVFFIPWSGQTARIRVDVSDSTGAVMVEVPVVVTNIDTGVAHSYKNGYSRVDGCSSAATGSYKISATSMVLRRNNEH